MADKVNFKRSHVEVYETSDYSIFKLLTGNRNISPERVNKIKKSLMKGVLPQPIIVNEHYEVIDGQARLQALKELGLKVLFVVQRGATIRDCIRMNSVGERWKTSNFIASWADQGVQDFVILRRLRLKYKKLPECSALLALKGKSAMTQIGQIQIRTGTFRAAVSEEEAEQELRCMLTFLSLLEGSGKLPGDRSNGLRALHIIYVWKLAPMDVLFERLSKNRQKAIPFGTVQEALRTFSALYNVRSRDPVDFVWEYQRLVRNDRKATQERLRNANAQMAKKRERELFGNKGDKGGK